MAPNAAEYYEKLELEKAIAESQRTASLAGMLLFLLTVTCHFLYSRKNYCRIESVMFDTNLILAPKLNNAAEHYEELERIFKIAI